MTLDKTHSEALAQLRHLYANLTNGGVRDTASAKRIAEGLLAPAIATLERWGSPVVAGEPVAWMARLPSGSEVFARTRDFYPDAVPVFTTPQPTQAQAGAADDTALIQQLLDAAITIYPHLNGLSVATDEALALLQQQIAAIAAARARLLDSDLSKLTERGAKAWAGVDAQKLREGGSQ